MYSWKVAVSHSGMECFLGSTHRNVSYTSQVNTGQCKTFFFDCLKERNVEEQERVVNFNSYASEKYSSNTFYCFYWVCLIGLTNCQLKYVYYIEILYDVIWYYVIILYYIIISYYIFYHVLYRTHLSNGSHWKTFCDVIGFPNVTFSDSTESVDLTNCQLKHVYYI